MSSVDVSSSPLVPRGLVWESGVGGRVFTLVKPIAGITEQVEGDMWEFSEECYGW